MLSDGILNYGTVYAFYDQYGDYDEGWKNAWAAMKNQHSSYDRFDLNFENKLLGTIVRKKVRLPKFLHEVFGGEWTKVNFPTPYNYSAWQCSGGDKNDGLLFVLDNSMVDYILGNVKIKTK